MNTTPKNITELDVTRAIAGTLAYYLTMTKVCPKKDTPCEFQKDGSDGPECGNTEEAHKCWIAAANKDARQVLGIEEPEGAK